MNLISIDDEDDYFYYLDADFQQTDNDGNMCVHKIPYISTELNSTYNLFTSQLPYNMTFTIYHPQEVPHNFTLKYENGTDFDLTSNTWLKIDYSDVKRFTNNDIVITFNHPPIITGSTYIAEYNFMFYTYTKDPLYPVFEEKYINISIYNEPINSEALVTKIIT